MKQLFIFILFLLFSSQYTFAQQVKKEGKYSMQKRQEKLALSSPGDITLKSYSAIKSFSLAGKTTSTRQEYRKSKPVYRTAKKSRRAIQY